MLTTKDFRDSVLQKRAARVVDSVQFMRDWGHPNERTEASLSKDALLAKIMSKPIEFRYTDIFVIPNFQKNLYSMRDPANKFGITFLKGQ